jgi:uncharacterized protein with HEPN domain
MSDRGDREFLADIYFGVNLDIVWQVATQELPDVEVQIKAILAF